MLGDLADSFNFRIAICCRLQKTLKTLIEDQKRFLTIWGRIRTISRYMEQKYESITWLARISNETIKQHKLEKYADLRSGLWIAVQISTPMLAMALAAGVIVGLFQALTSIQEATLTFVPKVGAMLAVFWVSMSFMTSTLVSYFHDQVIPMIAGG